MRFLGVRQRKGNSKGRKRARPEPEWDEEDEFPVEAILDKRLATKDDTNAEEGDVLYLVAWEGWDPSHNSWEPYINIVDDELIEDYERRAQEAEEEAESEKDEKDEEELAQHMVVAQVKGKAPFSATPTVNQAHEGVLAEHGTPASEVRAFESQVEREHHPPARGVRLHMASVGARRSAW